MASVNSILSREQYLYLAKLAEQAERYEEMVQFMRSLVLSAAPASELSVEERSLLSSAVKNVVGSHRAAWRIVSAILKRDASPAPAASDYRRRIESDLSESCTEVLRLVDSKLLPSAVSVESKVFFLKMKGDYHRYLAEIRSGDEKKTAADETMLAYTAGHELATEELSTTHPLRLGLALNFSVFYYEILDQSDNACSVAKKAFEEAIGDLDNVTEESYKDSTLIMQLLRDNLALWTTDEQEIWKSDRKETHSKLE